MKQQTTTLTRSRWLLVCLLSLLMTLGGTSSAWADAYTTSFETAEGWAINYDDQITAEATGWSYKGTLSTFTFSGTRKKTGSYGLYCSTSNSSNYIITPKLAKGEIKFWASANTSKSYKAQFFLCTKEGDESFTIGDEVWGRTSMTMSSLTSTMTEYSFDLEEDSYIAILLANQAGIDDFSSSNGLAVEGTLPKPTAFTNTATTYNSATFSWTAGGEETAWQLIYGNTEDFDKGAATPVEVSENPFKLTGLSDNTTYYAFLRATDGNPTPTDYSAWTSPVVSFTTPEQYPKPTDLTASSVAATSATLGWTKNGEETAWQIAYKAGADFDPTDGENGATTVAAGTNPFSLTGLTETTTYYAYVRAKIDEETFSRWSSVVSFTTPETYPTPTDFAQTAFTATTATLSWTANGGESKWNIKYSTDENFDPAEAGTLVAITANPYTLEGLTDGTTYYAYVQADYGSGHNSNWSNKITLTPTSTLNLLINDGGNTNLYVPFYGYYADQSANSQFIIPASELTSMTNRQITKLVFHSSTASANLGSATFEVYLKNENNATFADNTIDWSGMTKVYNSGSVSVSDNKMEITLSTPFIYTTGNLMVGFKQTATGSYPNISWNGTNTDNNCARYLYGNYGTKDYAQFLPKMTITSDELPAVISPTGLTTNSVSAFTATLGWTANGDEAAWQIALGTTSEFDPDGVEHIDANANPYTVTGLTAETTYYAYVRAKKGGDVSDWSNKVEFTTTTSKPTDVVVAPSDNSAKFSWTANAGETAWQIKYSTEAEFNPASEGTEQVVTTNPYTLTGLTPEITYYAYLRADLGGGEYSGWTAKQMFTTGYEHELTVNEGNGTTTSSSVPFYGSYTDYADRGWSQFIIPASQLGTMNGGKVNKITFYTTSNITWSSGGNPTFKVYIKEVDNETFASKEFIDWASMTEIYDGEIAFDGSQLAINLTTPQNYTGKNLMIGFKQTTTGGYCNTSWVGTSADNEVGVQNASGATTYNWAAFLPKTTFTWQTLTGPRLEVSTDALDFGEITQSSTAEDKQKTFTISNTGVAELTGLSVAVSGTGYSVSDLPRTNITTEGANATPIEVTVTFAPTTSGSYDGTVTVFAAGQPNKVITLNATYVADPILGVFNDVDATDAATTGETINFGYAEAAPTYTYYIKNTGAGTLDIAVTNGGFAVSPANVSLAAGEQQAFTITADVAEADATVTFTGTNHDGGAAIGTFAVTLQGTVMSETGKFFESFNHTNGTATTSELIGWEIVNTDTPEISFYNSYLYYWASGSESSYVITPKLRVSGTSDVLRVSAYLRNKGYNNTLLSIAYSADKSNWTEILNKGKSDLELEAQDFAINGIPEGSYYFKIEMSDVAVGYFYGFSTTLPDAVALNENSAPSLSADVVRDVTLTRNFIAGWNTICLPFAVAAADMESKFGADVKLYDCTGFSENVLSFEQVSTGIVAGKPYLIYVADAITTPITFWNATISATIPVNTVLSGVTFHGTFEPIAAGGLTDMYGVSSDNRIAKANASTTMKGFRGYLEGDLASARISIFDETTGISRIYDANEVFGNDAKVYNLNGQKVENAKKGLYIVNGKKVVVK